RRVIDAGEYRWQARQDQEVVFESDVVVKVAEGGSLTLEIPRILEIERKGELRVELSDLALSQILDRKGDLRFAMIDPEEEALVQTQQDSEQRRLRAGRSGFSSKLEGSQLLVSGLPCGVNRRLIVHYSDKDGTNMVAASVPFFCSPQVPTQSGQISGFEEWLDVQFSPIESGESWFDPNIYASKRLYSLSFFQGDTPLPVSEPLLRNVEYWAIAQVTINGELTRSKRMRFFNGFDEIATREIQTTLGVRMREDGYESDEFGGPTNVRAPRGGGGTFAFSKR
ncbi:MAG: hypothetical protein KDB07_07805, partial [Planctomycetes bacterium]|nr:hypothetical protein [Planctomycetota bacterium]